MKADAEVAIADLQNQYKELVAAIREADLRPAYLKFTDVQSVWLGASTKEAWIEI